MFCRCEDEFSQALDSVGRLFGELASESLVYGRQLLGEALGDRYGGPRGYLR